MAHIKPFKALRPHIEYAAQVASKPYDVLSSEEAHKETAGNLLSFLHVTKSEIDLPADVDVHSDAVYEKAKENLEHLIKRKICFRKKRLVITFTNCSGKAARKPVWYVYHRWKIILMTLLKSTNLRGLKKKKTALTICAPSAHKRAMCF